MSIIKNFFTVAVLAFTAAILSPAQVEAQQTREHVLLLKAQVERSAAAYIKFDGVDGECSVKEGRNVIGRNTRNGDQIIAVIRVGKLELFGVQPKRGAFIALQPSSAAPCFTIQCTTLNPPKCYRLPGGECVCVCGPWITAAAPGN